LVSSPFVGEIRAVPFNFAPSGWAFCNGQLMPISQNTALFSLLGTYYGGDGKSTFALPDLQGSAPLQAGQGQGLTLRDLGESGGEPSVTLLQSETPIHTHTLQAYNSGGDQNSPTNFLLAVPSTGRSRVATYSSYSNTTWMSFNALSTSGSSYPHDNMPPYLVVNFIIALQGVFPPRS
jgi:microcystin-dependent protein